MQGERRGQLAIEDIWRTFIPTLIRQVESSHRNITSMAQVIGWTLIAQTFTIRHGLYNTFLAAFFSIIYALVAFGVFLERGDIVEYYKVIIKIEEELGIFDIEISPRTVYKLKREWGIEDCQKLEELKTVLPRIWIKPPKRLRLEMSTIIMVTCIVLIAFSIYCIFCPLAPN